MEPIIDLDLRNKLKEVLNECIDLDKNPYDFRDEFIEKSGLDFCPRASEFLCWDVRDEDLELRDTELFFDCGSSDAIYLKKYCIENKYDFLYVVSTDFINDKDFKEIHNENDIWYLYYKFFPLDSGFSSIRSYFNYGSGALMFPEDRSFYFLLTDSKDIIAGQRYFIEYIIKEDIISAIENFIEYLSIKFSWAKESFEATQEKYRKIFYSKHKK